MIYTFYSYKGGVGRSMAMANVAEHLYRRGLRVVMIDWDLEAPGLESFFYDVSETKGQEGVKAIRARLGLVDLLVSYKQQFQTITFPEPPPPQKEVMEKKEEEEHEETDEEIEERHRRLFRAQVDALRKQLNPISQHLFALRAPDPKGEHPEAALWLMPAGWRAGDRFTGYAQAVQGFDWTDFYVNYKGKVFFEWMREELEGMADVILVDSRTGVTEMGGVCTRQLANVVVSCTVLNNQNMEGVSKMMGTFNLPGVLKARDGRRLHTIVVPTRVDTSDTDTRAGLIKVFEETFRPEDAPAEYKQVETRYWRTAIPYISKYAYAERLAIGAADYSYELQNAYRSLAAHLALFAPEDSPLRARLSNDLVEFRIVPWRVPAMAPPLPPSYANRPTELGLLREALVGEGAKVVALCGPPGSGKSSLAASAADDSAVKGVFRDGVLWLTLGARPDLKEALAGVYAGLTNETRSFSSEEEALKLVGEYLLDKRCLFVIDDAVRAEHVTPLLALSSKCSYLVTTRDMNLASDLHAQLITVGKFTPGQAVDYLAASSKLPDALRGELAALAQRLGHLPLLIKLAGEELRRRIESLGDDPSNAIAHANRLLDEKGIFAFDQPKATDRNKSVALSIGHSLDMLTQDELEQYLRLVLLLGDEAVGVERAAEIWGTAEASEGPGGRTGELEVEGRLQRLHALTLLEYDVRERRVKLDRLIRYYALERLPANIGLDIRAEVAFSELGPDEREAARRVLTRLVPVGGQSQTVGKGRRRARLDSFDEADRKVIEKLVSAGVLASVPDKQTGAPMIRLDDASLAQRWERLRRWVEADRDFLLWRQQVGPGVEEWVRGRGALLEGGELAAARAWVEKRRGELAPTEFDYVNASAHAFTVRRRRTVLLVSLGVIVALSSILYLWMRQQRTARADTLLRQGSQSVIIGDYKGAISSFNEAIELFPARAEYYNQRGLAYGYSGSAEMAMKDFNEAIRLNPDYAEAYFNRGVALTQGGDKTAAAADFNRVVDLSDDPNLASSARRSLESLSGQGTPPGNNDNSTNGNISNRNTSGNTNASSNSNQGSPHVSNRLYIKYADPGDGDTAKLLLMELARTGLKPVGPDIVSPKLASQIHFAQVRYYYDDDAGTAKGIYSIVSGILAKRGYSDGVQIMRMNAGGEGTGHVEVWLPSLKVGPSNNSVK